MTYPTVQLLTNGIVIGMFITQLIVIIVILNIKGHGEKTLLKLIREHNNPPLKLEELEERMLVWDNESHCHRFITSLDRDGKMIGFCEVKGFRCFCLYESGRFFRREVKE